MTSSPNEPAPNRYDTRAPVTVALGQGRDYGLHFRPVAAVPALMDGAGLNRGRCIVVTDAHLAPRLVRPLMDALNEAGRPPELITLPAGEQTKSAAHLQEVYDQVLNLGIDRKTPLIAFGGGVVGDLAGFAAATLLRGVPFVQIPTSLIAQVDSAIGGKTGINHAVGKNLIGAFYQPAFVCIDVGLLPSLPEREWTSGLAEVVKHALIADVELVAALDADWERILARDPSILEEVVYRAAGIKVEVVSEDEREAGRRALLNFGHTFGHAIERVAGYGTFTHGEAVACGMRAALHLSRSLHPDFPLEEADRFVRRIPVPGRLSDLDLDALTRAMQFDKKVEQGTLRYVVLRRIGEAYTTADVDPAAVVAAWRYAMGT